MRQMLSITSSREIEADSQDATITRNLATNSTSQRAAMLPIPTSMIMAMMPGRERAARDPPGMTHMTRHIPDTTDKDSKLSQ